MAMSFNSLPVREALVEIARDFHARGWMAGTGGNLSARAGEDVFWITASGKPKGRLDDQDFLLIRLADGAVLERGRAGDKPSAETAIHQAIYQCFPGAQACLHGHSVEGYLALSKIKPKAKYARLPPIEMVKGFDIWQQHPKPDLPLFENHLDVARIAAQIQTRFTKTPPDLSALMVRDHGATVWGANLQEAYNRFETLEFILSYMARQRGR